MPVHVHIPTQFVSRYSLLGRFAQELAEAFTLAGAVVNAPRHPANERGLFVLFNTPERIEQVKAWIESTVGELRHAAILHYHVDHPFALHAPHLDQFASWPTYRLLLPCRDDLHLLRLRWPSLKHLTCAHGVAPASLCPRDSLRAEHLGESNDREAPLVLAGSIHSPEELVAMFDALPASLRSMADAAAHLIADHPSMPFTQAFDLTLPRGLHSPDHWRLMEAVWRCATAKANTLRRTRLAKAMQGVPTLIAGPKAWEPHCEGTLRYAGEVAYEALPALLRRARVCVAWGPTQFAHTFSERLLLSMAAGCATVTDDRLATREAFGEGACTYADFSKPDAVRAAVDGLLSSREAAATMSERARAAIESGHLWTHRLDTFAAAAADCWR